MTSMRFPDPGQTERARRRLDLLPPTPDTDPAAPTLGERVIVLGGLWALPLVNTMLLIVIIVLLR
jgi:hypothetical protein